MQQHETDAEFLTNYIAEHIPLSQAMGFEVRAVSETGIELFVPLAPNINHRDSVFGGSISAAGIMAGWGLLHHNCRMHGLRPTLVVQESTTKYLKPILSDFLVTVQPVETDAWRKFFRTLEARGKARLRLTSVIQIDDETLAEQDGTFVAMLRT